MIEISKKHYDSLVYWANRGYKYDGQAYLKEFPNRKDPYYKINKGALKEALGDTYEKELQEYIEHLNIIKTKGLQGYIEHLHIIKTKGLKNKVKQTIKYVIEDLQNILISTKYGN